MSKGILVMDMPETCGYCGYNALCGDGKNRCVLNSIKYVTDGYEDSRPDWCPIKRALKKEDVDCFSDEFASGYAFGWNTCIDEIIGGSR